VSYLSKKTLSLAIHSFSKTQWRIFLLLSATLFVSFVMLLNLVNNSFLVDVPLSGGTVTEGVMGTPRFINPVLAVADVEKDINALVYSGLMKKDGIGNIIPDLADSFTVSPDGLIYTFTLKQNLTFHCDRCHKRSSQYREAHALLCKGAE
jgi:peptide/nickel transport system substrate-binding protein